MPASVLLGIDDAGLVGTPGTNQLARHLVRTFGHAERPSMITRHQLLEDPQVPCTRKNGCVAVRFESTLDSQEQLIVEVRKVMRSWCPAGSDPGLCAATAVPREVVEFGRRCQIELVTQQEARDLAARHGIHLEGLGGTEGGVIGALAALGLHQTGDDGRVVHLGTSQDEPFDVCGPQPIEEIFRRGVEHVFRRDDGEPVFAGTIHLEKKLRPNLRRGRVVLFVVPHERFEPVGDGEAGRQWQTVRVV
jgi:hypothetical protein